MNYNANGIEIEFDSKKNIVNVMKAYCEIGLKHTDAESTPSKEEQEKEN